MNVGSDPVTQTNRDTFLLAVLSGVGGGGGGGERYSHIPIYNPCRYVPPQRVSFSSISSLK